MLLLFQKDLCRNCPVPGHLAEVKVSQAEEGDAEGEGRSSGCKEWKKLQKGNEQMEAEERIDVEEERLMEVQGGGKCLLLHTYTPHTHIHSHSLAFFLSHSDMSIQLCFTNMCYYEMCCRGNHMAH